MILSKSGRSGCDAESGFALTGKSATSPELHFTQLEFASGLCDFLTKTLRIHVDIPESVSGPARNAQNSLN
jgi:hypothetical protein